MAGLVREANGSGNLKMRFTKMGTLRWGLLLPSPILVS